MRKKFIFRPWTQDEKDFVFKNYKTMSDNETSKHINRTSRAISKFRELAGLQRKPRKPKPKDSINNLVCGRCLQEKPKTDFTKSRANTLVNQGYEYICKECRKQRYVKKQNNSKQWSNKEIQLLIDNYRKSVKELVKILNRTPKAIAYQKLKLGLRTKSGRQMLSQEEADKKDVANGAIPIGKYNGAYMPREYQCVKCGAIYLRSPAGIRNKKINKFNGCGLCLQCIKEESHLLQKHSQEYVEQEFAKYGLELQSEYTNNKCMVQAKCICGRVWIVNAMAVLSGHTTRCGHCDDPKIDEIYGLLTIVEVDDSAPSGCIVKARCKCDKIIQATGYQIKNGHYVSCGTCIFSKSSNIVRTKLWPIIAKILNKNVNKIDDYCEIKIQGWRGGIDIVVNDIAIEYDGYWFHRSDKFRLEQDKIDCEQRKEKVIRKNKYKLLRIRSDGTDIPTEAQLRKVLLNDFQHGCKKKTITMKSWKEAKKKYNAN